MTKPKISKKSIKETATTIYQSLAFSFKQLPLFTVFAFIFSLSSYIFDYVKSFIDSRIIDSLIGSVAIKYINNDLLFWLGLLTLAYIFHSIMSQLDRASALIYFGRFDRIVSSILARKLSLLDISYFEDPKFNKLIQKVQQNSYKLRAYLYTIIDFLAVVISLIIASAIVINIDFFIFLLLLASYLPYSFPEFKYGKSLWGIWDSKGETKLHSGSIYSYLTNPAKVIEVKTFGMRHYLLNLYDKYSNIFLTEQLDLEKRKTGFRALFDIVGTLSFAYAYYVVLQKTVGGEYSIGTASFYVASISRMWSNVNRFFGSISKILEDNLYIKDYFELINWKNKVVDGPLTANASRVDIEFKNVWFKYPSNKKYVFKDFSFSIKAGERLAIVGENGAGKTTLTKLLLRFYDVSKGEILVNGKNIKEYSLESYYKLFALLSQEFVKYHFNAKTNIALGNTNKQEDFSLIQQSAKLSGADSVIKKFDNKYDQILSNQFENGTEPSTGQWQKIALARAFFKNSPVLILDEPTSAIDPKAEYKIFEKLFDFAKNKTVLIISHRFSTVRNADRIIVLDGGKVVEEGSHKELLQKNGIYKEAYDLQKKGYEDV